MTMAIGSWANEPSDVSDVVRVEFVGTSERAVAFVAELEGGVGGLQEAIRRDHLYIAAYVAAVAWFTFLGTRMFRMRYSRELAAAMTWAIVMAGLADVVENIALLELLDDRGRNETAARVALAATIPKWILATAAVATAVVAMFAALVRAIRSLRPTQPPFDNERAVEAWTYDPTVETKQEWNRRTPAGDPPGRFGVCFSGGGIRSATFNLGAIQVLTDAGLLRRAEYLSAVSGGGYIAGALQMVAHRYEGADDPSPALFAPQAPETAHLRLHGRYLADTGRELANAIARVVAGTLLNLLVLGLVLFAIARPIGWLQHHLLFPDDAQSATPGMWWAVAWTAAVAVGALLVGTITGDADEARRSTTYSVASWFGALSAIAFAVIWLLPEIAASVPGWVREIGEQLPGRTPGEGGGVVTVVVTAATTLAGTTLTLMAKPEAAAAEKKRRFPNWATVWRWVVRYATWVTGALLATAAVLVLAVFMHEGRDEGFTAREGWLYAGVASTLFALYAFADQNRWSLAPFYKRRLATAFAVERTGDHGNTAGEIPYDVATTLSTFGQRATELGLPKLILCAAANTSDPAVAPPGRRAVSYVFTADHVGGPDVGWSSTKDLEAMLTGANRGDATLLGAMAISGAAFASAMGRNARGSVNALLAVANARLGVWLPSPRYIAEQRGLVDPPNPNRAGGGPGTWVRRRRFIYLLKEIFGVYDPADRFVYLTDGGHYDNLGLIELLRRQCSVIACFDASGDDIASCGTLQQALLVAHDELDVTIDIDVAELTTRSVATGRIVYADGTVGRLVFAKASLTPDVPFAIRSYALRSKAQTFPNDGTFDQFFDYDQFDAYRALGHHIAGQAVAVLEEFLDEATASSSSGGSGGRQR